MRIQINSDKNVAVDTRVIQFVRGEVNRFPVRFGSKLTRVGVHLSDVNSRKFGINDKRCLIEAIPARHRPLTATNRAQPVRLAVDASGKTGRRYGHSEAKASPDRTSPGAGGERLLQSSPRNARQDEGEANFGGSKKEGFPSTRLRAN